MSQMETNENSFHRIVLPQYAEKVKFLLLEAPKGSMVAKFFRSYFGGIMLKSGFTGFFLLLPQFSEFTLGRKWLRKERNQLNEPYRRERSIFKKNSLGVPMLAEVDQNQT